MPWSLQNSAISVRPPKPAPLFRVRHLDRPIQSGAGLFRAVLNSPSPAVIAPGVDVISGVIPPYVGDVINLPGTFENPPVHISVGGIHFTPSLTPLQPRPYEFAWDAASKTVKLHLQPGAAYRPSAGLDLQIRVPSARLKTDIVLVDLVEALEGINLDGEISWSESLEGHPSGSIQLVTTSIDVLTVRERFKNDTEITIAGIGFYVSQYQDRLLDVADYPGGYYSASIALSGKWSHERYTQSVFVRPRGQANFSPFADPECLLQDLIGSSVLKQKSRFAIQLDLTQIALRNGAVFRPCAGRWRLPLNETTLDPNATVEWVTEAQNRLRQNGAWILFSNPAAVEARKLDQVTTWNYRVGGISLSDNGRRLRTAGFPGYAIEYKNTQLTGEFTDPPKYLDEDTLARNPLVEAKWKQRERVRVTLEAADARYWEPFNPGSTLKTLSLNFDQSGPTKSRRVASTLDGSPDWEAEWVWGYLYLGRDSFSPRVGIRTSGNWQIVSFKFTSHKYDDDTGYLIGSEISGWKYGRFRQESDDKVETYVSSISAASQKRTAPYEFVSMPVFGGYRPLLKTYAEYYPDQEDEPQTVEKKVCNPDGSSRMVTLPDPGWAPAMFVLEEVNYNFCFAWMENPESTASRRLPPLTTGDETRSHLRRVVRPGERITLWDSNSGVQYKQKTPDLYTEWVLEDAAQNAGFGEKSVRESYAEKEGRPPGATRRSSIWEKEEPEQKTLAPATGRYDYFVTTPGHEKRDRPIETLNVPLARTLAEATTYAEANLRIQDIQSSADYIFSIPFNGDIRPMDRINVTSDFENHQVRVKSYSQKLRIQGRLEGRLIVSAPDGTSITAGVDRVIPVQMHRKVRRDAPWRPDLPASDNPAQPDPVNSSFVGIVKPGLPMGWLMSRGVPSRTSF